jgi:hypothetical protein
MEFGKIGKSTESTVEWREESSAHSDRNDGDFAEDIESVNRNQNDVNGSQCGSF